MTKITTLAFSCFFLSFSFFGQSFITTWKTDNPGTSSPTSITIPTTGGGYNYDVDWNNDGVFDQFGLTGTVTHDFGIAGNYTIRIQGAFPRIYFNNGGDVLKILSIDQWGSINWTNMSRAFFGASNLTYNATDIPNLTGVSNLSLMFRGCTTFNGNIGSWTVSNVNNMASMFRDATAFNQNIGSWVVSNVTNMNSMFYNATSFDQNIGGWTVSNATNMSSMFRNASAFNQNISGWNVNNVNNMSTMFRDATSFNQNIGGWVVSNVTNMNSMFYNATSFNQNIGGWMVNNVNNMASMFRDATAFDQNIGSWGVGNVTNMSNMFRNASAFNQNIGGWTVSNVTNMNNMLRSASAFNQSLAGWNITSVTNMANMLSFTAIDTPNYDAILAGWEAQSVQTGITLGASGLIYCNSEPERTDLISNSGWTITGDAICFTPLPIELVYFSAFSTDKGTVELNWETSSEFNNDYFTVERSADIINWENVKRIKSKGNSTYKTSYRAVDEQPLSQNSYYRLKQTDFDGKYQFSHVEKVNLTANTTIDISPNPTRNIISLKGNIGEFEKFEICNISGDNVTDKTMVIFSSETLIKIDLANLESGIYIVKSSSRVNNIQKL